MYVQRNAFRAADHYRHLDLEGRLAAASPHQLVSILYESLDTSLAAAIMAYEQDKGAPLTIQMGRARSILLALEAGLDFERGTELASTLAAIYRAMQRRLSDVSDYPAALTEVQQGVSELARSWNALAH
jgi:flagellar secretion chaperone FliS